MCLISGIAVSLTCVAVEALKPLNPRRAKEQEVTVNVSELVTCLCCGSGHLIPTRKQIF